MPFLVCWPAKLKPGESQAVVSALDILPTALAAAGIESPTDKRLDGMNLLPVLQGQVPVPARNLFWCSGGEEGWWAVRSGDWKVVGDKGRVSLFDLSQDVSESKDLSKQMPEKLAELTALHDAWLAEMPNPVKSGSKKWSAEAPAKAKKLTPAQKKKAREEQRAKQKAAGQSTAPNQG